MARSPITDIRKLREPVVLGNLGQEEPPDIWGPPPTVGGRPQNAPIFNTPQIQAQAPPMIPPPSGGAPTPDMIARWQELYKPETQATDRFNNLVDTMPQREKPSIARSIAASGIAIKHGYKGAEDVMYAPHTRAMADWKEQTGPAHQAANLERYANANERTATGQMVQANLAQEKNEIARSRAAAYSYNQMLGKGWDWDLSGPTAKKFNKSTGEVFNTGIPTGKMDEELKIELQNEGRLAAAQASATGSMERVQEAGWDTYQYPDGTVIRWNKRTGEKEVHPPPAKGEPGAGSKIEKIGSPNAGATPEPTSPLEVKQQKINKANDMKSKYPEWAARIKVDKDGGITVEEPKKGWMGGYDQEEIQKWQEINKYIFGLDKAAPGGATQAPAPTRKTGPVPGEIPRGTSSGEVKPRAGKPAPAPQPGARLTNEQQMEGINNGTRVMAVKKDNPKDVITIAYTTEGMEWAVKNGYKVEVGKIR